MENNWDEYRDKIIGLGENSFKKSYYPELQSKIEELEASKSNFETIFNSTSDAIVIHDIEGRIINMNMQALILCNILPEEISKYTIYDISSEKNDNCKLKEIWVNVSKNGSFTTEWIVLQIGTKKEINAQVSINKTYWDKKDVYVAVIRDFTERKEYEQRLISALERAEESDKLKTAFLQNMSHEIRTPLNAISGFAGLLDNADLPEDKRRSFIQIIQDSSNQLISIVTDILTISALETKQEKLNISKVCINKVLTELFEIFKPQTKKISISINTEQQLTEEQSEIFTDKTKITQILSNLLSNALKFTQEGSVEFGYSLFDNQLKFYVKDSGIGIKPEFHSKIFERFRQADKSINKLYSGTGLGLAISKAFVELLDGKIWVESEFGKGSTFYFTIPYKSVNKIENINPQVKQSSKFKSIIVAEDEEFNYLYLKELLSNYGLKIIYAKDGKEAIEKYKLNPNIDLILMDIKMPVMTGDIAAMVIKSSNSNIPIIAQSAYALNFERAKYEGIFDGYLTKPIKAEELKQIVFKYI